jgi:Holliday junction resolvase RusA-like endonuclease
MKLIIPKKIESQNKFQYSHWIKYKRHKDTWFRAVWDAITDEQRDSHGDQKKRVEVVSYRTRLLDRGNLVGGAKPVLDALKHFGLIRDDSPKWIEDIVRQVQKQPDEPERTEIEITNF